MPGVCKDTDPNLHSLTITTMPSPPTGAPTNLSPAIFPRDSSPDSLIVTTDSSFALFSSAYANVHRCSFASDAHDHGSFLSESSQHLAGHERRDAVSSGPDPDANKASGLNNSSHLISKERAKVRKHGDRADMSDETRSLDSARSSFSLVLKECQDRRVRSEILLKKADRRRPSSLDLNNSVSNAISSSPRLGVMKKSSGLARAGGSGAFPSPGTPNHWDRSICLQKGWSSERVPLHANMNRRHTSSTLTSCNNERTLPSKWEDAERWIFSPVSGDGAVRHSNPQTQRRPKSKSGPLGPPGIAYYSMYSPAMPMLDGCAAGKFAAGSPFSTAVIAVDGGVGGLGKNENSLVCVDPCIARSVSVHGCSELLNQLSLIGPEDVKREGVEDTATTVSISVSTKDMATQMSPNISPSSSPMKDSSFNPTSQSMLTVLELQNAHYFKPEVRDVEVDELVTMTSWSKKQTARNLGRLSLNIDEWKSSAVDIQSSSWSKREEARITAWENLQRAKAEAAIRKVEMKLEKKRTSSMEKIMNKLKLAQKKAHEMRSSALANQAHQVSRNSRKAVSLRRTSQMGSLSGCFTCHAF